MSVFPSLTDPIRLVVPTIALLVAGWIGHGVGSARLDETRAALTSLRQEGESTRQAQDAARAELTEQMQRLQTEHEARLVAQRKTFDEQKIEMAEAFDEVQERLTVLSGQRQSNETELRRVRLQLASASIGPAREELNRREAQLVTLQQQIRRLQAGLNCLQAPVPDDALKTLNRVSASRSASR
jgi:chromosome segregation ATPase